LKGCSGIAQCKLCDGGSRHGNVCDDNDPNLGCPGNPPGTCAAQGGNLTGQCVRTCSAGPKIGLPCNNDQNCGSCAGGGNAGLPCDLPGDCPGGACTTGVCGAGGLTPGFCRDRCGRCN
jgi:hypothetical protein